MNTDTCTLTNSFIQRVWLLLRVLLSIWYSYKEIGNKQNRFKSVYTDTHVWTCTEHCTHIIVAGWLSPMYTYSKSVCLVHRSGLHHEQSSSFHSYYIHSFDNQHMTKIICTHREDVARPAPNSARPTILYYIFLFFIFQFFLRQSTVAYRWCYSSVVSPIYSCRIKNITNFEWLCVLVANISARSNREEIVQIPSTIATKLSSLLLYLHTLNTIICIFVECFGSFFLARWPWIRIKNNQCVDEFLVSSIEFLHISCTIVHSVNVSSQWNSANFCWMEIVNLVRWMDKAM